MHVFSGFHDFILFGIFDRIIRDLLLVFFFTAQLYENSAVELTNQVVASDTTGQRKASGDASVIVVSGRDGKFS